MTKYPTPICCGILFGLMVWAVPVRAALTPDEIASLLESVAASRSGEAVTADFREVKEMKLLEEPVVQEGSLAFLWPDCFLREVVRPDRSATYYDGETLWLVFPEEKRAERYPVARNRTMRESMDVLAAAFGLRSPEKLFLLSGEKSGSGFRLTLIPKSRTLRKEVEKIEVRISGEKKVREIVVIGSSGNRSVVSLSREHPVRMGVENFRFHPPKGFDVSHPLGE